MRVRTNALQIDTSSGPSGHLPLKGKANAAAGVRRGTEDGTPGNCVAAAACGRFRRPAISAAAPLAGRANAGPGTASRQGGRAFPTGESKRTVPNDFNSILQSLRDSSLSQREPSPYGGAAELFTVHC